MEPALTNQTASTIDVDVQANLNAAAGLEYAMGSVVDANWQKVSKSIDCVAVGLELLLNRHI